jgi:hypothetical protein
VGSAILTNDFPVVELTRNAKEIIILEDAIRKSFDDLVISRRKMVSCVGAFGRPPLFGRAPLAPTIYKTISFIRRENMSGYSFSSALLFHERPHKN